MKKWLVMSGVLFLVACAGVATKKEAEPVLLDNPAVFAGKNEVILGDFRVTFVTFDKASAVAESPMFSSDRGYARTSLRARLVDVPESVMQSLTDKVYGDFIASLSAKGYRLADASVLAGNTEWQKMKTLPSPQIAASSFKAITGGSQESATFAPTGRSLIDLNVAKAMPYHAYFAAEQIGTPILSVHYTVHFVYFGSETDYTSNAAYDYKGAEYSAEVTAGQGIQVMPGSGVEWMMGAAGTFNNPNGKVTLGAPVLIPGPFGISKDATSGMQKAANVFSSALGMVSGGSSSAKDIEIKADPTRYAANVEKALLETNQRLLSSLAGAR